MRQHTGLCTLHYPGTDRLDFFSLILEDMNELEAAKILIGGLIASGQVKDERDLRLLQRRLKLLEDRIAAERGRKP